MKLGLDTKLLKRRAMRVFFMVEIMFFIGLKGYLVGCNFEDQLFSLVKLDDMMNIYYLFCHTAT